MQERTADALKHESSAYELILEEGAIKTQHGNLIRLGPDLGAMLSRIVCNEDNRAILPRKHDSRAVHMLSGWGLMVPI